jgi:hypothetical protein
MSEIEQARRASGGGSADEDSQSEDGSPEKIDEQKVQYIDLPPKTKLKNMGPPWRRLGGPETPPGAVRTGLDGEPAALGKLSKNGGGFPPLRR